jgi:hypothetical protein
MVPSPPGLGGGQLLSKAAAGVCAYFVERSPVDAVAEFVKMSVPLRR